MSTPTAVNRRRISIDKWLKEGEALFGQDKDAWQFVCVLCGHVQSAQNARQRNPMIDEQDDPRWLRNYLARNCEGRLTPGIGCDWSLGGLFQIHTLEIVLEDQGEQVYTPCMEFFNAKEHDGEREGQHG